MNKLFFDIETIPCADWRAVAEIYNYMNKSIDIINKLVSQMTVKQIGNLSNEEVQDFAVERPGYPGQRGFLLSLEYFESGEHLSKIQAALMMRLIKVKK